MSPEVIYCFEDEDIEAAAHIHGAAPDSTLIVLSGDKRLVGIASLGDLAVHAPSDRLPGEVTDAVAEPAEPVR
jgi:hypothetical protein